MEKEIKEIEEIIKENELDIEKLQTKNQRNVTMKILVDFSKKFVIFLFVIFIINEGLGLGLGDPSISLSYCLKKLFISYGCFLCCDILGTISTRIVNKELKTLEKENKELKLKKEQLEDKVLERSLTVESIVKEYATKPIFSIKPTIREPLPSKPYTRKHIR